MTRTEIAGRLRAQVAARGHQAVMADLQATLNRHQAFCQVTRHRWQLGKDDARVGSYMILAQPPGSPGQPHHDAPCARAASLPAAASSANASRLQRQSSSSTPND
jgi:hypothetical protein